MSPNLQVSGRRESTFSVNGAYIRGLLGRSHAAKYVNNHRVNID